VWQAPRWLSSAPAAFAGLENSKGAIAPGFDADIVIVNPGARTRVSADRMRSRQRRGALEGREFDFSIDAVYLRGEAAGDRARGRMVRPVLVAL
jgi:dihydroorotase-like cyclic amidohydrolase